MKICALLVFFILFPQTVRSWEYDYILKVDFSSFSLLLLDGAGNLKDNFRVALPKGKTSLPVEGEVIRIEKDCWWYPTEPTRQYYLKTKGIGLPAAVNPSDRRNAMGAAKIVIAYFTSGVDPTIRIHGTNDEGSIGKRISRGCIRMKNSDILKLILLIQGKNVKVIFV